MIYNYLSQLTTHYGFPEADLRGRCSEGLLEALFDRSCAQHVWPLLEN